MNNLLKIMCISVMLSSTAFGIMGSTIHEYDCVNYGNNCD